MTLIELYQHFILSQQFCSYIFCLLESHFSCSYWRNVKTF